MKAIYINLDPYIRAARPYFKGATDTPPELPKSILPVSVTLPPGETAALICQTEATVAEGTQTLPFATWTATVGGDSILSSAIATGYAPRLSAEFADETANVYAVPAGATEIAVTVTLTDGEDTPTTLALPPITVVVNRAAASGPVELVDFSVPATLSGVDLAGATWGGTALALDAAADLDKVVGTAAAS